MAGRISARQLKEYETTVNYSPEYEAFMTELEAMHRQYG